MILFNSIAVFAGEGTKLTIGVPESAKLGDVISVKVNMSNALMAGGEFTLTYDNTILKPVSGKAGAELTSAGVVPVINNKYSSNAVYFTFANVENIDFNGCLAEYTFEVVQNGKAEFKFSKVSFSDYDLVDLVIEATGATLNVGSEVSTETTTASTTTESTTETTTKAPTTQTTTETTTNAPTTQTTTETTTKAPTTQTTTETTTKEPTTQTTTETTTKAPTTQTTTETTTKEPTTQTTTETTTKEPTTQTTTETTTKAPTTQTTTETTTKVPVTETTTETTTKAPTTQTTTETTTKAPTTQTTTETTTKAPTTQTTTETTTKAPTTQTTTETTTKAPTTQTTTETTTETTTQSLPDDNYDQGYVKAQKVGNDSILFVAGIDSLNYKEVGFVFESDGVEVYRGTNTVYTSVSGTDIGLSAFDGANYLYSFEIDGIEDINAKIDAVPYFIDINGKETRGKSSSFTLNGLSDKGELALMSDETVSGSSIDADAVKVDNIVKKEYAIGIKPKEVKEVS